MSVSKPGGTCSDIKAPVATIEKGRKQRFCHDKVFMSRQEIKEQYKKNTATSVYVATQGKIEDRIYVAT